MCQRALSKDMHGKTPKNGGNGTKLTFSGLVFGIDKQLLQINIKMANT